MTSKVILLINWCTVQDLLKNNLISLFFHNAQAPAVEAAFYSNFALGDKFC